MTATKGIEIRPAHYPGRAPIDAYGNGGFRFADMSHRGSLLCLPSGVHGWEPGDPMALVASDFASVLEQSPEIEILLIGCGFDLMPLAPALRDTFREHGISADSMSTGAAVRTFNVLLAEDRAVAAALIAID